MIPFNKPSFGALEKQYESMAFWQLTDNDNQLPGSINFIELVRRLFSDKLGIHDILLTTSCTHSLELAALACGIRQGDEVIMPSFTFSSTANAFVLRGAKPVFCEVDPKTMNIDTSRIEGLVTKRTRAVVPVHYGGVVCDMDSIGELAAGYDLYVIEDAAQALGSMYRNLPAGRLSDAGCHSFHTTKNYSCFEGGSIVFSNGALRERAEIISEYGTNRNGYLRGEVDKYTWRDVGSSYRLPDVLAAVLAAQMERFDEIMLKRLVVWKRYHDGFDDLEKQEHLKRPFIPAYVKHNAHMYYIILPTAEVRMKIKGALRERGIMAATHYEPLHSSRMGREFGYKAYDLPTTSEYAARLLRLPLFTDMPWEDVDIVIEAVHDILR